MNQNAFEELQARVRALNDALCAEPADISEAYVDEVFERLSSSLMSFDKRKNAALSDSEYRVLKRRKKALMNLLPTLHHPIGEEAALSVPAAFVHLNAPCITETYDEINRRYDVELGAAIWILDALVQNDALEEAVQYFPDDQKELAGVYLPNLSDSVHSDDMLRAMIALIRKGSRLNADPLSDDPLPYREAFEKIIELIGDNVTKSMQQEFIGYLTALTDRLLDAAERRCRELNQTLQNMQARLTVQSSDATVSGSGMDEDATALQQQADDLERFFCLIPNMSEPQDNDPELYADVDPLEITDPYGMCYAFLSLIDSDRDEAWLCNLSYTVLTYACQALPWAGAGVVDPDNTMEEIDVDYEYLASLIEKTPDWDDDRSNAFLYKRLLPSPLCMPVRRRISISQLTFLSSGLIPPRHGGSISYTKALLNDAELSDEQSELLYEYFALAYAINHKEPDYSALEDDAEEGADSAESIAEVKLLRSEIKRLKNTIHQFERRNKDTETQLAEANKKLDAANRELAELRTMIRESVDNVKSDVAIDFPYTAKKRSVIIGGHDSWLKAIKPLLENVRYISSSENPNPNIILNCEVVWLQTNALGHSGYYKIIDLVRRNRIKVCYFSYASAEKCAEQFALEDSAEETSTDAAEETG